MPNNRAAAKRMRQEQKRRLHNRSIKSLVKTQITKARQAIAADADAEAAVRDAVSDLDRAAKKGVIHRNNAARRKSRLMKQLNAKEVLAPNAPPPLYYHWLSTTRIGDCRRWLINKS